MTKNIYEITMPLWFVAKQQNNDSIPSFGIHFYVLSELLKTSMKVDGEKEAMVNLILIIPFFLNPEDKLHPLHIILHITQHDDHLS